MKGLRCLVIVVFSFLSIAGPALADPFKTATIDLLLQREAVGAVFIDDERGQVYFERIVASWSPDGGYAFTVSPTTHKTTVSKIYVAPMDGSSVARPLFNQAAQDAYAFARSNVTLDAMSPNGRYLAIHHLTDGVERLGIYDLKANEFTHVDAEVERSVILSEPIWIGDDIIATAKEDYSNVSVGWDVIKAARNIAAVREAGWRGDEVMAEVIGSGNYAQKTDQQELRSVISIDVSKGKMRPATVEEQEVQRERFQQAFRKGFESAVKYMEPNPAALNPPKPQSLLLASSDRGEVFLTHDKGVGSQLEFVSKEKGAAPVLLIEYNTHLSGVETAVGPIQIDHKDYVGEDAKSWLFLPPGASVDRPMHYPLVVIAYPTLVYDAPPEKWSPFTKDIWTLRWGTPTPMEVFAAEGYAVLLPSIPYAKDEGPAEPMLRIMAAVDSALDGAIETGFVDPDRMALTGQSFGGYAALSVAVQSDRFQAIVSAMPVSNITSVYGTFGPLGRINANRFGRSGFMRRTENLGPFWLKSQLWENPDRYIRNSPLFSVENVSTPILLIAGDLDAATPVTQAEEMFIALYHEEKDVQFVKYFGEHHVIAQPEHQRDMWQRVFNFLEDNGVTPGLKMVH